MRTWAIYMQNHIVHKMNTRIGLHTGPMVTGNMGSEQRMNYTMMGDTVNLAARLEASSKQYGVYTQISEDTYRAVEGRVVVRELDFVKVVGKLLPVRTYELIAPQGEENELYKTLVPDFHEALETYRSKKFNETREKGIEWLKVAKNEIKIPIITEVMEEKYLGLISGVADILQIGSRNMQNYPFLTACAKTGKPIMLKRHYGSSLRDWLGAAEYILYEGNINNFQKAEI